MANKDARNVVRWQDGSYDPYHDQYKEIITKKSYWNWVEENGGMDAEGSVLEHVGANPDQMSSAVCESTGRALSENVDALRVAAFECLSPKEQEVWELCMRQGLTEVDAAAALNSQPGTVHKYMQRAKVKFVDFLREHGEGGEF